MTWCKNNAVHKKLRPVIYFRHSAETRLEDANKMLDEKCRKFAEESYLDEEMRQKLQDMMKRVAEDDSIMFAPVMGVTQWKRSKNRNRRRAKP